MLDGWVAAAVIVAAPLNPGSDSLGFAGSRADSIRRYTMPSWVDSVESSPEWIFIAADSLEFVGVPGVG